MNRQVALLGLRGLGVLNYESRRVSGERFFIKTVLPDLLPSRPSVVDVGANVGDFVSDILLTFPEASVLAFEPHPLSAQRLVEHYGGDPRVTIKQVGLGSEPTTLVLYDRGDMRGSSHASLYRSVITDMHGQETSEVEVVISTLDAEMGTFEARIDLLKIDTEGHDLEVLRGARNLLASSKIGVVQFEFGEANIASRTFLRDFHELLPHHHIFRLLPVGMLPLGDDGYFLEVFGFQNLVAIPKDASM